MFVIKAKYGASPPYYMPNNRLHTLSCSVVSRLSETCCDAMRYFRLYRFELRMMTDLVWKVQAIH